MRTPFSRRILHKYNILRLRKFGSRTGVREQLHHEARIKDSVCSRSCFCSGTVGQSVLLPHPLCPNSKSQHWDSRNNMKNSRTPTACACLSERHESMIEISTPFPIPPIIMIPLKTLRILCKEVDVFKKSHTAQPACFDMTKHLYP